MLNFVQEKYGILMNYSQGIGKYLYKITGPGIQLNYA